MLQLMQLPPANSVAATMPNATATTTDSSHISMLWLQALALREQSKRCLLLRGRCQLFLGNNDKALADAERALALGGKDALVRNPVRLSFPLTILSH